MKTVTTNHSVFIDTNHEELKEYHGLSRVNAFKLAMNKLYTCNEVLIPNVRLMIRTPNKVVFTASNPLKNG